MVIITFISIYLVTFFGLITIEKIGSVRVVDKAKIVTH